MIAVVRTVCGVLLGLVAIYLLFAGIIGFRQARPTGSVIVVFGMAATAGAIGYYLLSPSSEPVKRRKRSSSRRIAMPQDVEADAERRASLSPQSEGIARVFDPNTWNFDLAKVTAAGWVFGFGSVAGMLAVMAICVSVFNLPAGVTVPRWISHNKWIGGLLLAPITVWFIFGAKVMKSLGFPVFRDERAKPSRTKPNGTRSTGAVGGLPPRRPSAQGLPPRRRSD